MEGLDPEGGEVEVALPVALEGGAALVVGPAVGFDDEARTRPVEVCVVRADGGLQLRLRQTVTAAQPEEHARKVALGWRLGAEHLPERRGLPSRVAGDGRLELGEVEDGAGDRGDPDAVDGRDVLVVRMGTGSTTTETDTSTTSTG
jgi:hypothetical protein